MALDCDGNNDFINHGNIGAIDGASALTIMCWLFRDTSNGGDARDGIFRKAAAGNTGPYIEFDFTAAGQGLHAIGTSTFGVSPAGTWTASSWYHFAQVFDGAGSGNSGRLKVYKNASEITLSYNGTIGTTIPNQGAQAVGFGQAVNAGYYDGKIALVKVWTAALSAAEIAAEMHSYRPVRWTNLLIWSPYDDGTDARDYSGNANHGTATNGPTQVDGPPVSYGGE